ncbi:MAG: YfaP family protein, partial [Burkholderiaceae bacterium]
MSTIMPIHIRFTFSLALLLTVMQPAKAQVSVDTPRGGWRYSGGEAAGFLQQVNYPASSVNAAGHSTLALIKGHIAGSNKEQNPAKLVVNGIAMPLSLDEGDNFERPYAFGAGSNSIEVRSASGKERKRVQFYDANAGKPQARLRVVLSWDSDGTDLDLHVVSPDGEHVFYGNRVAANGSALDVDVTTGYGPEIFASVVPPKGVYHVYVNYYGSGSGRQDV